MATTTGVAGLWGASLAINGSGILPSKALTPLIEIKTGIQRALPSLHLVINDQDAEVSEAVGGVKDGMTVDVTLADGKGGPEYSGTFRIMGGPTVTLQKTGLMLDINAVLDKVGWLRSVVDFHLPNSPSSAMIAALAGKAGLGVDVDPSGADIMTWLPNNKPLVQYAEMVMQRAGGGAAAMGVTANGILKFKKLSGLLGGGGGITIGGTQVNPGGGKFPYIDWNAKSNGMLQNASAGWGQTTLGEKNTGIGFELDQITALMSGLIGGISSDISSILGGFGSRIISMGVDSGNVHDTYYDAQHQNQREKAAWSNSISALLVHATGKDLFDSINFVPLRPMTGQPMSAYAGEYAITNKVMTFRDGLYLEKLTATNSR